MEQKQNQTLARASTKLGAAAIHRKNYRPDGKMDFFVGKNAFPSAYNTNTTVLPRISFFLQNNSPKVLRFNSRIKNIYIFPILGCVAFHLLNRDSHATQGPFGEELRFAAIIAAAESKRREGVAEEDIKLIFPLLILICLSSLYCHNSSKL